jgi:hypothetical protein
MERPAKSAVHRVAGLMWAFVLVTIEADLLKREEGAGGERTLDA